MSEQATCWGGVFWVFTTRAWMACARVLVCMNDCNAER